MRDTLYIHSPSLRRRARLLRDSERKFSILRCFRSSRWILDRPIGIIQFVLLFGYGVTIFIGCLSFLSSPSSRDGISRSLGRSRPINFAKRPAREAEPVCRNFYGGGGYRLIGNPLRSALSFDEGRARLRRDFARSLSFSSGRPCGVPLFPSLRKESNRRD